MKENDMMLITSYVEQILLSRRPASDIH